MMGYDKSSRSVERTARNIDLAFQLLDEVIADDDRLEQIPDGGTIVLLPFDDPRLVLENLAMAQRLSSSGKTIYLRRIGSTPIEEGEFVARLLASVPLRWVAQSQNNQWSIEYDHITNTEVIDFSGGQRSTFRFPISQGIALLVDSTNHEAVGYSVPETLVEHLESMPIHEAREGDPENVELDTSTDAIALFTSDLAHAA